MDMCPLSLYCVDLCPLSSSGRVQLGWPEYSGVRRCAPKVMRSRRGCTSVLYLVHLKHQLFMHVMSISILGHVRFVTKNHLHASLGREITFLCDIFGHIDGAKWLASQRDLVTFDAPGSTPQHQLNPASVTTKRTDFAGS